MNLVNITYPEWSIFIIVPLLLWAWFWKALALWHSARHNDTGWFIAFVIINTLGILEIVYLFSKGRLRPGKLFSK